MEWPDDLMDTDTVCKYLQKLDEDGIASAGQLTKLSRLETALNFAASPCKWESEKANAASRVYTRWKKVLMKEKTAKQKKQRPIQAEDLPSAW